MKDRKTYEITQVKLTKYMNQRLLKSTEFRSFHSVDRLWSTSLYDTLKEEVVSVVSRFYVRHTNQKL